jgi:DNA-binding NarL/FixJ family response regulator
MFDRQLAGALPLSRTSRASAAFRRRWLAAACTGYRDPHRGLRLVAGATSATLTQRPQPADSLTPRQREVAALIALGLTNRQIAERLVISLRTADNHVQHIFDKLGLSSRAQVAAWIAMRGMLCVHNRRDGTAA